MQHGAARIDVVERRVQRVEPHEGDVAGLIQYLDGQVGVLLDQGDQFDAVHARHVNVGDHEIEMTGAHGIPAVHAVHGDFDFVTVVAEKLAFQFTHR